MGTTADEAIAAWDGLASRRIAVNGIELQVRTGGWDDPARPPVVLCHGFPELGFSWRHQIAPLLAAGHRVIVPDMRGYGGSSKPEDPAAYDIVSLTGDLTGLLDALGLEDAVFVGHDWGAAVVWNLALLHPERVRAVAGLSVPPTPHAPVAPLGILRSRLGDDFYICWFQQLGEPDRALRADVRRTLLSPEVYSRAWAARDEPAAPLPSWQSEKELAVYTAEFEAHGFTGGLNYYRNMDRNWELTAHLAGRTVDQPSLFVIGSKDPVGRFTPTDRLGSILTDLREHVVLDGAGHWIQQQRPAEVNAALLRFLGAL